MYWHRGLRNARNAAGSKHRKRVGRKGLLAAPILMSVGIHQVFMPPAGGVGHSPDPTSRHKNHPLKCRTGDNLEKAKFGMAKCGTTIVYHVSHGKDRSHLLRCCGGSASHRKYSAMNLRYGCGGWGSQASPLHLKNGGIQKMLQQSLTLGATIEKGVTKQRQLRHSACIHNKGLPKRIPLDCGATFCFLLLHWLMKWLQASGGRGSIILSWEHVMKAF